MTQSEVICDIKNNTLKNEPNRDIVFSPKRNLSFQNLDCNKQESYRKNLSNLTITESNEDEYSFKYFDKNQINENNNKISKYDEACKIITEEENKIQKNKECIYKDPQNYNENVHSTLIDENMECPNSTNDFNSTVIKNSIKIKDDFIKNIDDESDSSKELFEKTNDEMLSNESLNDKNNKSNFEYNLNLNENDNLSNYKIIYSLGLKSSILQDQKVQSENLTFTNNLLSSSALSNRKRGRQRKKNPKNKKDDSKCKENLSNSIKPSIEFISSISKKNFIENAWVHLSCALWIPEVNIEDFLRKENIKSKIFINFF